VTELTQREIVCDGGWLEHAAPGAQLREPYRNHLVTGGGSGTDSYFLPRPLNHFVTEQVGRGVAIGTVLFVHNAPDAAQPVLVKNAAGTTIGTVPATKSGAFVLMSAAGDSGEWIALMSPRDNDRGEEVPGVAWRMDAQLTGKLNSFLMLSHAVANGYDGTLPAIMVVTCMPGSLLGSNDVDLPAYGTDLGVPVGGVSWHADSLLVWRNHGEVGGRGGAGGGGGVGGTGASAGVAGGKGGLAVYVAFDLAMTNAGQIRGGGGGGGGGNGSAGTAGLHGGPGGGGRGCFVQANGTVVGGSAGVGASGTGAAQVGSSTQAGAGGLGTTVGANTGGHGGAGGDSATAGTAGNALNNGSTSAAGGAAGPAIVRETAATLTVVQTGTIVGSTVVV
jgi:hypothetical protein